MSGILCSFPQYTVTCFRGVTVRRVLNWMSEFIALTHSTRNYKKYGAIADLHILQFTVSLPHTHTHTRVLSLH
jgi:hypothetical protein